MLFRIDESSERPIYVQIADSVRRLISEGRIGSGAPLPSATEVAEGLGVHQHTVLKAYQLLRDEGLIDLKRRRGATVTKSAARFMELQEEIDELVQRSSQLGIGADALASMVAAAAHTYERTEEQ